MMRPRSSVMRTHLSGGTPGGGEGFGTCRERVRTEPSAMTATTSARTMMFLMTAPLFAGQTKRAHGPPALGPLIPTANAVRERKARTPGPLTLVRPREAVVGI